MKGEEVGERVPLVDDPHADAELRALFASARADVPGLDVERLARLADAPLEVPADVRGPDAPVGSPAGAPAGRGWRGWTVVGVASLVALASVVALRLGAPATPAMPAAAAPAPAMPAAAMPAPAAPAPAAPAPATPAAAMPAAAMPAAAMPAAPVREVSRDDASDDAPARRRRRDEGAADEATSEAIPLREGTLLLQARRALAAGDAAGALAAVDAHAHEFPRGAMRSEREVLAVEALDALGRAAEARARGARFLQREPRSPYRARVERVLAE